MNSELIEKAPLSSAFQSHLYFKFLGARHCVFFPVASVMSGMNWYEDLITITMTVNIYNQNSNKINPFWQEHLLSGLTSAPVTSHWGTVSGCFSFMMLCEMRECKWYQCEPSTIKFSVTFYLMLYQLMLNIARINIFYQG